MVLSVPFTEQELEAIKVEKMCWFYVCDNYEAFRTVDGCDNLINLPAVLKDLEAVQKIADAMGIPNDAEHRIVNINPTKKELQDAYKTILRKQIEHM